MSYFNIQFFRLHGVLDHKFPRLAPANSKHLMLRLNSLRSPANVLLMSNPRHNLVLTNYRPLQIALPCTYTHCIYRPTTKIFLFIFFKLINFLKKNYLFIYFYFNFFYYFLFIYLLFYLFIIIFFITFNHEKDLI